MTTRKIEQRERLAVLKGLGPNDRASTFHQFSVEPTPSGRFANLTSRITIGEKPTIDYPAAAAWTQDHLPDEPPLNQDVNVVEPVGTHAEIKQSLREVRDGTGQESPLNASPSGDGPALPRGHSSSGSSKAAAPSPRSKRKAKRKR